MNARPPAAQAAGHWQARISGFVDDDVCFYGRVM